MRNVITMPGQSSTVACRWRRETVSATGSTATTSPDPSSEPNSRIAGPTGRTDVQAGVRYDFEPRRRAYLIVGLRSLRPYWFDVDAAVFLSDRGDLLARVEGSTDFRLTQRLILQPRAELDFAAQDVRERDVGLGLSTAEFGVRLRYQIRREFAPYVGVNYARSLGETADFARAAGEYVEETRFVFGVRAWF
ncbi:copper resistance protein B [uncultured Phenylobacterium sp.]|uniref:copper resistance protein B n=1 Tax=uncultured Phenylobacterium sp. TaxID=349273 RepID=UPI00345D8EA9